MEPRNKKKVAPRGTAFLCVFLCLRFGGFDVLISRLCVCGFCFRAHFFAFPMCHLSHHSCRFPPLLFSVNFSSVCRASLLGDMANCQATPALAPSQRKGGFLYGSVHLHQRVRKRHNALANIFLSRDSDPISARKVLQKKKARERKIPGFNGNGNIIKL